MKYRVFLAYTGTMRFRGFLDVRTKSGRAALRYAPPGFAAIALPHRSPNLWPDQNGELPSILTLQPGINYRPAEVAATRSNRDQRKPLRQETLVGFADLQAAALRLGIKRPSWWGRTAVQLQLLVSDDLGDLRSPRKILTNVTAKAGEPKAIAVSGVGKTVTG